MTGILFVCSANVYRSRVFEAVMRREIRERDLKLDFDVDSAGVFPDYGSGILPVAAECLSRNGVPYRDGEARALSPYEYGDWDLIICLDSRVAGSAALILGGDPEGKISVVPGLSDPPCTASGADSVYRAAVAFCTRLLDGSE